MQLLYQYVHMYHGLVKEEKYDKVLELLECYCQDAAKKLVIPIKLYGDEQAMSLLQRFMQQVMARLAADFWFAKIAKLFAIAKQYDVDVVLLLVKSQELAEFVRQVSITKQTRLLWIKQILYARLIEAIVVEDVAICIEIMKVAQNMFVGIIYQHPVLYAAQLGHFKLAHILLEYEQDLSLKLSTQEKIWGYYKSEDYRCLLQNSNFTDKKPSLSWQVKTLYCSGALQPTDHILTKQEVLSKIGAPFLQAYLELPVLAMQLLQNSKSGCYLLLELKIGLQIGVHYHVNEPNMCYVSQDCVDYVANIYFCGKKLKVERFFLASLHYQYVNGPVQQYRLEGRAKIRDGKRAVEYNDRQRQISHKVLVRKYWQPAWLLQHSKTTTQEWHSNLERICRGVPKLL